jgi:sulfoxide reductase heme-binding subunit YedZ
MPSIDLWYATRATGLASLVLLSAVVVVGILSAGRAETALPRFARVDFHRRLSAIAASFLTIHVLTSVMDTYVHMNLGSVFLPYASAYKPGWVALGAVSVDLFLAVAITSLLRRHIPAAVWRGVHWLAYLSWPIAISHSIGIGTDMHMPWVLGLVGGCVSAVAGSAGWRLFAAYRDRAALPALVPAARRSLRTTLAENDRR